MARKLIRQWRLAKAEPSGLMVWFDPASELVRLYDLVGELEPPKDSGVDSFSEKDEPGEYCPSHSELNEDHPQGDLPF